MPPTTNPTATEGKPATAPAKKDVSKHEPPRDTTREIFETVVFVVVLVLMLKLFVAEAFVIPTGSMASTLWGDQARVTCRECGHEFPVNISDGGRRIQINSYICENCGFHCAESEPKRKGEISSDSSGDRVLVSKYEYHLRDPKRFDVPVFKYPVEPFSATDMQGMNYIKRLVGLGGETLAVFDGDLYTTRDLNYEHIPTEQNKPAGYDGYLQPSRPLDAWQFRYMYAQDKVAMDHFRAGNFQIVRKSPDQIMAVRRIVFNLDKQPKSPTGVQKTRWNFNPPDGEGLKMEEKGFTHSGRQLGWVRYQHIDPWNTDLTPHLIIDALGYNVPKPGQSRSNDVFISEAAHKAWVEEHWVSDLILDCTAEIGSPDDTVVLELNKGPNRCRAIFTKGQCQLVRYLSDNGKEEKIEMGSHDTKMTKSGKYKLRFANVDSRLTVWVDNKPIAFAAEQSDYLPPPPTKRFTPTPNDRQQPARVGAEGDVKCTQVSLWRDLQYLCGWDPRALRQHPLEPESTPGCDYFQTYYVQPGHYLMMGDNVNSSKDSRSWGLVPERLMLGRAVVVYWPFWRLGVIE